MISFFQFILWNVNPDIFVIPGLDHPVRWYGVSWALAFFFSQQVMYHIYQKENRSRQEVDTLTIYMVVASLVGARLGHVLFYDPLDYLAEPWRIFAIWEGGLASHGGAVGILFALYLFARKTNVPYLWIVDRMVIVSALSGIFIRLGNLMNSEVVGIPSSVPWAFIFTRIDNTPRHPAQLYEALYCLVIFAGLFYLWARYRQKIPMGAMTGFFLITLFTLRFVDEFFKINQVSFEENMPLNMGQLLSIPFVVVGALLLIHAYSRKPGPAT